jgi:hypothetical protein
MSSNFVFEAEMERHLEAGKEALSFLGSLVPMAYIYTEKGFLVEALADLSDRDITKQKIRKRVRDYNAYMVIIVAESWISNDVCSSPSMSKDRRSAIHIYGETADQNMIILQEFDLKKSGKVKFGDVISQKTPPGNGKLSGFFKP